MRGRKPEPEGVRAQKAPVRSKHESTLPATEAVPSAAVQPPAWLKGGASTSGATGRRT